MKLLGFKFKVYRNEFGVIPQELFPHEERMEFREEVGLTEDEAKDFWVGVRCSRSIINDDTKDELYGHLSGVRAIIVDDRIQNDRTVLIKIIEDFYSSVEAEFINNRPANFPRHLLFYQRPAFEEMADSMIQGLIELSFY